jgi:hypothetical protein
MMQEPTGEAEASISTENAREGPNWNRIVRGRRKAAKRTLPWDLKEGELDLMSSPLQDENIRLTKKPRLGEPLSASLDEAAAKMSSHGTAVSLPAAAAAATDRADADPVDAYLVKGIRAKVRWTSGEDAKLNSAVTSICKKKYDKGDTTDWAAVAALVPGRLGNQCYTRWRDALDPTIDRTNKRRGKWAEDEDIKLKDAVQTRGAKNWPAIAALVPGRTKNQSYDRWHNVLDPRINRANSRVGIWAEEEDIKLKDAVQTHGGKKWGAVASLVPSRTKKTVLEQMA